MLRAQVEEIAQLLSCALQCVRVVTPVAPTSRNRKVGVHHVELTQLLSMWVFIVLNTVTNSLQADSRSDSVEAIGAGG